MTAVFKKYIPLLFAAILMVALSTSEMVQINISPQLAAKRVDLACKNNETQQCLARELAKLTFQRNLQFAFTTLEELQKTNNLSRDCHFLAHSIAAAAVQADPGNWRTILDTQCPTSCSYGCSHGVIEAHALQLGRDLTQEDLLGACDEGSQPSCPHGIGHLLLLETGNNLDRSVADCHGLPDEKDRIFQCVSGVFMENFTPVNLLAHGIIKSAPKLVDRIPEIEATCRRFAGVDAAACWQEVAPAVMEKQGFNAAAVSYCDGLPDSHSIRLCQYRMVDTYAWVHKFEIGVSSKICAIPAGYGFTTLCSDFLTSSVLDNLPSAATDVAKFCLTLGHEPQTHCYAILGDNLSRRSDLNPKLHQAACVIAPTKMQGLCTHGGNIDVREEPAVTS